MDYQISESLRRHREERDEFVRTHVRWWRRKRMRRLNAIADEAYDYVRRQDAERAERGAAQASGERRAERTERADELLGHAGTLDERRVAAPCVIEVRVQPAGEGVDVHLVRGVGVGPGR